MAKQATQARGLTLLLLAAAMALPATACKKAPKGRGKRAPVQATISEFNPEKMQFDLDKYGTARVDDYEVGEAFNRSFEGLDTCVMQAKERMKMPAEKELPGDVEFQVQLDPENPRPMGVNAKLSDPKLDGNSELKDCLREAVAGAGYPTYDGPPQVAEFQTDLDPGMMMEEDW